MPHPPSLEPALVVAGAQVAQDLGAWVLHVARTHPRLADVVGWARVQSMLERASGGSDQTRKAWIRLANWLESLDPMHYPEQVELALEQAGAPWRGPASPKPTVRRADLVAARNAKPLPVCPSCNGLGTEGA